LVEGHFFSKEINTLGSQPKGGEQPLGVERLREAGVRPRAHYALDILRAGKSRHGDDPDVIERRTRAQAAADLKAIHARHHQVEQQRVRSE
jgi:hypothetical protein